MPMKSISKKLLIVWLVSLSFGLWQCSEREPLPHQPDESRLRERINTAYDHFFKQKFDDFIEMRSERERRTMFESEEEKIKGIKHWEMFVSRDKPTVEILTVEIKGNKAIAKMRGSILREDGSRPTDILYDLWVFERGDWFLDDAQKASPEYLPRD